jgi:hypothetical protein
LKNTQKETLDEDFTDVESNGKYGFIDKTGIEVIPCIYDKVKTFYDGLVRVKLNEKWGFIDKTGAEVIPIKYDHAEEFYEDFALVKFNDKVVIKKT